MLMPILTSYVSATTEGYMVSIGNAATRLTWSPCVEGCSNTAAPAEPAISCAVGDACAPSVTGTSTAAHSAGQCFGSAEDIIDLRLLSIAARIAALARSCAGRRAPHGKRLRGRCRSTSAPTHAGFHSPVHLVHHLLSCASSPLTARSSSTEASNPASALVHAKPPALCGHDTCSEVESLLDDTQATACLPRSMREPLQQAHLQPERPCRLLPPLWH